MREGKKCSLFRPMRYFVNSTGFKKDKLEITKKESKDNSYQKWMYFEGYNRFRELKRRGKLKV